MADRGLHPGPNQFAVPLAPHMVRTAQTETRPRPSYHEERAYEEREVEEDELNPVGIAAWA